MMKMQMHLDKSQIAGQVSAMQVFGQSGTFDRTLLSMAGYTDFDVVIVSAAGGRSGIAYGTSDQQIAMDAAGGGGGGVLRAQGKLVNLDAATLVVVGQGGANAATDSTTRAKAPNGSDGGPSIFGPYIVYGGQGGQGGRWTRQLELNGDYIISPLDTTGVYRTSKGGAGGTTYPVLGSGGAGGANPDAATWDDTTNSVLNGGGPQIAPTSGTWETKPRDPYGTILSGAPGGGGGPGGLEMYGHRRDALPGGAGSVGGPKPVASPGAGAAIGGTGAGGDIGIITGGTGVFGTGQAAGGGKGQDGAIAIKVS